MIPVKDKGGESSMGQGEIQTTHSAGLAVSSQWGALEPHIGQKWPGPGFPAGSGIGWGCLGRTWFWLKR